MRQKKKKKRKRTKKRQRRRQRGAAKAQGDALAAAAKAYRLTGSAARPRRAAARTRRLSELLGAAALGASAPLLAELAIVRALAAGDDTAKSRAALEAAKKICPGHARVSLIAALLDLDADDEKRRAAALKAFRAALAAGARHPRATLVRVRLLLAQGKLDEAQKLVDAQSPRPVASRLARGEIALLQGDAHAALRSVRRAGNGQAVTLLGTRALLALGRVDAAAKRLARLSDERTKQSFAVALLTAELHAARGDQKALVAELERAKTLAGADAARLEMVAPLLSARALLAQSKPKRIALRAAAKLLQIVTKHENAPGRAYRLLGETLAALERKVAARAAFEQAIKLTPKDALAHFGLAEIAAAGKSAEDKAAARAAFKRFLELSRRDERARRKRARRALRQL